MRHKNKNKERIKLNNSIEIMQKSKTQKGITLVALVVTIIVLIILAGVSINLLLGQNGIVTRAKQAKVAQTEAEVKQKVEKVTFLF